MQYMSTGLHFVMVTHTQQGESNSTLTLTFMAGNKRILIHLTIGQRLIGPQEGSI